MLINYSRYLLLKLNHLEIELIISFPTTLKNYLLYNFPTQLISFHLLPKPEPWQIPLTHSPLHYYSIQLFTKSLWFYFLNSSLIFLLCPLYFIVDICYISFSLPPGPLCVTLQSFLFIAVIIWKPKSDHVIVSANTLSDPCHQDMVSILSMSKAP